MPGASFTVSAPPGPWSPIYATPTAATRMFARRAPEVPAARRFVRDVLADHPACCDAELLTCELVTNAVQHATDAVRVTVAVMLRDAAVHVDVIDDGCSGLRTGARPTGTTRAGGASIWSTGSRNAGDSSAGDPAHGPSGSRSHPELTPRSRKGAWDPRRRAPPGRRAAGLPGCRPRCWAAADRLTRHAGNVCFLRHHPGRGEGGDHPRDGTADRVPRSPAAVPGPHPARAETACSPAQRPARRPGARVLRHGSAAGAGDRGRPAGRRLDDPDQQRDQPVVPRLHMHVIPRTSATACGSGSGRGSVRRGGPAEAFAERIRAALPPA